MSRERDNSAASSAVKDDSKRVLTCHATGALAITARALARIAIVPFQTHRRDADEIERLEQPHLHYRVPYPLPIPAPRRSNHAAAQAGHCASALECPRESHVFHQRDVRVAAQFRENLAPHKDRLVAGADFRNPPPKADHQTNPPEHRPRVVQLKVATTTENPLILQCRTNIVERGWRKPGVGMKKKQHVAGPALRAEVHLSRPPTGRRVKFHAEPLANLPSPVTALSVDKNQLVW